MTAVPRSEFIYVTYIRTTPEKLWAALTEDTEFMKQYWFGTHCESAWTAGAAWKMVQPSGSISDAGEIIEAVRPKRLVIRWEHQNPEVKVEGFSTCTMEMEPSGSAVKLSIRHSIDRERSVLIEKVSGGWPKILANLKSLLETGDVALDGPYRSPSASASSDNSVRKQIVIKASAERTFTAFTEQLGAWWPRTHKIGKSELKSAVMEPKVGGRWYEIDVDGQECLWGKVLTWEPPRRVVLAWQIDSGWQYDPNLLTEVEVTFTPLAGGRTQIDLEHRDLDRFGAKAEAVRKALAGEGGWTALLASFGKLAEQDTGDRSLRANITFGNHMSVLVPRQDRDAIRKLFCDVLGGTIAKREGGGERDFIRVGDDFYVVLYGDVPDASELHRSARAVWLELKTDDVEGVSRKLLESGLIRKLDVPDPHLYFQAPGGQCFRLVGHDEDLSFYEGTAGDGPDVAKVKAALGKFSGESPALG